MTNGVEWFATEKIDVHGASSLNWGARDNMVDLVARLNRLTAEHPAFGPDTHMEMVQRGEGNFIAVKRTWHEGSVLVLLNLDGLKDIRHWAAYHHEKLSGNGYPFHFDEHGLDTGDQILAVADIFSVITEERPYRAGMPREKASAILKEEAQGGNISDDLVTLLIENYDQVDAARDEASHLAGKRYFDSLGQVA